MSSSRIQKGAVILSHVMAGLVPGIHVEVSASLRNPGESFSAWMPGTSPGMTRGRRIEVRAREFVGMTGFGVRT